MLPNELGSLFTAAIEPVGSGGLRIVVVEAAPQPQEQAIEATSGEFISITPIKTVPGRQAIELLWDECVAYFVVPEHWASVRDDLPRQTKPLAEFDDPLLTQVISAYTIATPKFPGPLKSWQLLTLDDVVIVTSAMGPRITHIAMLPEWTR